MEEIQLGMIGSNYGAFLHCDALQYVGRLPFTLKTICYHKHREPAQEKKERYGFQEITDDYHGMLADPEINTVDIVAPPLLHLRLIRDSLEAGKNVICEKPLTGYLAAAEDPRPVGDRVPKEKMYHSVLAEMEKLRGVIRKSGKHFYYAENFVYAPAIQKAGALIAQKKSKILMMKAFFGMKGSSSPLAGDWAAFGGGCWYRNGVHPLGAILWLKLKEGLARGEEIHPVSVTADMGRVSGILNEREHRHIAAHPVDVEDNSTVVITFSDGTKATILLSDTVVGGSRNTVDLYTNDGALECRLVGSDVLNTCFMDDERLEDTMLSEMNPNRIGWNRVFVADGVLRGYAGELREFMTDLLADRDADLDFEFGCTVAKIIYAAYCAAEQHREVVL